MDRRTFLLTSLAGALTAPTAAEAQQAARLYRIGIIANRPASRPEIQRVWDALFDGLRDLGYVESKNMLVERRYAEGRAEQFPKVAAELVDLKVDLIMVFTTPAALAARNATTTILILFISAIDPRWKWARRQLSPARG